MASTAADNLAAHAEAQCGEVEVNDTMVYAGMVLVITAVLFEYKRLCAANNEAVVRGVNDALNACALPAQHRAAVATVTREPHAKILREIEEEKGCMSEAAQTMGEASASSTQIFTKKITGKTIALDVELGDTIMILKQIIEDKEAIPIEQQRIIFKGKELHNDSTMLECGIARFSDVTLLLFVLGGMEGPQEDNGEEEVEELEEEEEKPKPKRQRRDTRRTSVVAAKEYSITCIKDVRYVLIKAKGKGTKRKKKSAAAAAADPPLEEQPHAVLMQTKREFLVEWEGTDERGNAWKDTWVKEGDIRLDTLQQ
jgi:hypothetical protein